jgi:hypothetical protein
MVGLRRPDNLRFLDQLPKNDGPRPLAHQNRGLLVPPHSPAIFHGVGYFTGALSSGVPPVAESKSA